MRMWILIFSLLLASVGYCQRNKLDDRGRRQGKWKLYWDSTKAEKMFVGRFRHGIPKGTARYYDNKGQLARKEKIRGRRLKTRLYFPGGQVYQQGSAYMKEDSEKIHYFFDGRWKEFDEKGKLVKYLYYTNGKMMRSVYLDPGSRLNDSLTYVLNELEVSFNSKNETLLDSIAQLRYSHDKRDGLQTILFTRDTVTFNSLRRIMSRFGYPGKAVVGSSSTIPFYILSHAPAVVKQTYIDQLRIAADSGAIDKSSLAFYIDKCRLELHQKQVYGTQKYLKNKQWELFPVEDPEHLSARRKEMNLAD